MDKSVAGGDAASSPQPKRRFWRFFLWGIGVGGVFLILFLNVLIPVVGPDLRREVTAPVISGSRQAESPPLSPTSSTLSVSPLSSSPAPTSETQAVLNLDDFPHLSQKMRELGQAWLDQYMKTRKVLDVISDSTLRAQVVALLNDREMRMRTFLNRPLEWENQTFDAACLSLQQNPFCLYEKKKLEGDSFWEQCPEFDRAINAQQSWEGKIKNRLYFELCVHSRRWQGATDLCERMGGDNVISWDEEVYCWRQMGASGRVYLAGRSYMKAIDAKWDREPWPTGEQYYRRLAEYAPYAIFKALLQH
ncbi:MAG TPA: hypothetical protein PLA90_15660 [Candidatus Sumerlaeota bacterium]|nr:hypothetical protein [Candidatus Sumerlaeota bacterium]